jgi:hypothetical protein
LFTFAGRSAITTSTGVSDQQRLIDQCDALENYHQQQHLYRPEPEQPESIAPPQFVSPIKDQKNIHENGFAHFDARLEPSNDSTMKVEWFKDGRPVEASKHIDTVGATVAVQIGRHCDSLALHCRFSYYIIF